MRKMTNLMLGFTVIMLVFVFFYGYSESQDERYIAPIIENLDRKSVV